MPTVKQVCTLVLVYVLFMLIEQTATLKTCFDGVQKLLFLEQRTEHSHDYFIDDRNLSDKWYRTFDNGVQYLIPYYSSDPGIFVCGTHHPVYLKDPHPEIASLTEEADDLEACVASSQSACSKTYNIKVRRCDSEIQYYLLGTGANSAFCFEPLSPVLSSTNVTARLSYENKTYETTTDKVFWTPFLQFHCDTGTEGYVYTVNWYLDNELYKEKGPSSTSNDLYLSEKELLNDNKKIGFWLKCGVLAAFDESSPSSMEQFSSSLFVGMMVDPVHLFLPKTGSASVKIKPTVPIGCQTVFGKNDINCHFSVAMNYEDLYECTGVSSGSSCAEYLNIRPDETWDPSTFFEFEIKTVDWIYEDPTEYVVHFKTSDLYGHSLWQNYTLQEIKISVTEFDKHQNKICYATVDPHFITSDNMKFDFHGLGEFMMLRNIVYEIMVQIRTTRCQYYSPSATCVCGVIVRAGGDVFQIDRCGDIDFIGFQSCNDNGILIVTQHGITYYITTPIGSIVAVEILNLKELPRTLNVRVYMSPKDYMRIKGLCGNFNSITYMNDDFRKRDGTQTDVLTFAEDWRLRENESLFIYSNIIKLPSWKNISRTVCVCNNITNTAQCTPLTYSKCSLKSEVTQRKCVMVNKRGRRRRSLNRFRKDSEELSRLLSTPRHADFRDRKERSQITSDEIIAHCTELINGSLAFTKYKNHTANINPIWLTENCIFDIEVTGDTSVGTAQIDVVNSVVRKDFDLRPSLEMSHAEEYRAFLRSSCHNNCSGYGLCNDQGECQCDALFHGPDCSVYERDPVDVLFILGGVECDLREGDECACVYVFTTAFLPKTKCRFTEMGLDKDNNVISTTTFDALGDQYDMFSGMCCQSSERSNRSRDQSAVALRLDISISNDGQSFGASYSVYQYDSTCQNLITVDINNTVIVFKSGYCYLDGVCVRHGKTNVGNPCLKCNSDKEMFRWTHDCTVSGKEDSPVGIIVGVVLGIIILTSVIMSAVCWKKLKKSKMTTTPVRNEGDDYKLDSFTSQPEAPNVTNDMTDYATSSLAGKDWQSNKRFDISNIVVPGMYSRGKSFDTFQSNTSILSLSGVCDINIHFQEDSVSVSSDSS